MNTKLLRQKILDLAIRGKLTEQKKSDGTTRDLLKQIASNVILSNAKNPAETAKSSRVILSKRSASKDLAKEIVPLDKSEAPFEIPENWEWVRLGDVCEKITDGTHHSPINTETGDFMYVTAKNIKDEGVVTEGITYVSAEVHKEIYARCAPAKGDILLIKDGATTGVVTVNNIDDPFSLLSSVALLKPGKIFESWFLAFVIRSNLFNTMIRSQMKGVGITRVTLAQINSFELPLPPLAEQQRIVTAIENAFAEITEIENNQELLKKHIKQGRQKILDLAIRGKLTQQLKTDGTTKDLLESIMAASSECHPERSAAKSKDPAKKKQTAEPKQIIPLDKTTAPFEIPSTWEWVKINDIALDMADGPFGSNLKAEHYTDKKEARIIQLSNIAENGWRDENVRYTTFEHAKNNVFRSVVEPGNLVVAKMMPAGRTMICPSTEKMYVLSSDAVKLVPNDNLVDRQFLCLVMNSPSFRAQINDNIQGTTRLRTSISKLRDCMLALPPLAEQQRIVATIEQSFAEFNAMEVNL